MDPEGLMHALDQFAETAADLYKVNCRFSTRGKVLVDDSRTAEHLYRIAQEAVRNAVKHGGARTVTIQLFAIRGQAGLVVKDNGRGYDPAAPSNSGMGLRIMRHRAQVIDANFAIDPGETGGTVVSVVPQVTKTKEMRERASA